MSRVAVPPRSRRGADAGPAEIGDATAPSAPPGRSRFQRARRPAEKDLRRNSVLRAARQLSLAAGPMALTMGELGRRSGVSKANIYRYFESREEVLLQLLVVELGAFVVSLERSLPATVDQLDAVADRLARGYLARPLLCQLLSMMSAVLEHNVSAPALARAKDQLTEFSARLAAALAQALPRLSTEQAAWAMQNVGLYVAGMWPSAHPSAVAAQVMRVPAYAPLRVHAGRDLRRLISVLLGGLLAAGPT